MDLLPEPLGGLAGLYRPVSGHLPLLKIWSVLSESSANLVSGHAVLGIPGPARKHPSVFASLEFRSRGVQELGALQAVELEELAFPRLRGHYPKGGCDVQRARTRLPNHALREPLDGVQSRSDSVTQIPLASSPTERTCAARRPWRTSPLPP